MLKSKQNGLNVVEWNGLSYSKWPHFYNQDVSINRISYCINKNLSVFNTSKVFSPITQLANVMTLGFLEKEKDFSNYFFKVKMLTLMFVEKYGTSASSVSAT